MRTRAKIFLLAFLALIISCNKKETTLEQYINTEIASGEVPGIGISIIVKGDVLLSDGYGYADIENQIPFTDSTIMNIASISKTFIGVSMMHAVEKGLLNLDDDVNKYLSFKIVNPHRPDKKIMVLDGDGSLLMNLGSLVTVAGMEPKNFLHFVFEDGAYWTTGGQPIPGNGKFNLSAMANDAGYKSSHSFEDLETLVSELPSLMRQDGPIFVSIKITHPEHAGEPFIGSTKNAMEKLSKSISGY